MKATILELSTYNENRLVLKINGSTVVCHLADMVQWDELYDELMRPFDIHVLEVDENGEYWICLVQVSRMRRWVIADLHFGHTNVIDYANRPFFDVEEMERELIKNWNNTVAKDDIIYVLGDFTLSRRTELISRLCGALHGHKVLVMGNHDTRKPADYVNCGFRAAIRKPILVDPRVVLSHEPPAEEDIFCGMKYIYGHVHEKPCAADKYGNCRCVSVERINYTPVDLDQLIAQMDPLNGEKIGYQLVNLLAKAENICYNKSVKRKEKYFMETTNKFITLNIREYVDVDYEGCLSEKDINDIMRESEIEGLTFTEICDILNGVADDRDIEYTTLRYNPTSEQYEKTRVLTSVYDFFFEVLEEDAYNNQVDYEAHDRTIELDVPTIEKN